MQYIRFQTILLPYLEVKDAAFFIPVPQGRNLVLHLTRRRISSIRLLFYAPYRKPVRRFFVPEAGGSALPLRREVRIRRALVFAAVLPGRHADALEELVGQTGARTVSNLIRNFGHRLGSTSNNCIPLTVLYFFSHRHPAFCGMPGHFESSDSRIDSLPVSGYTGR